MNVLLITKVWLITITTLCLTISNAVAEDSSNIAIIDSATPTKPFMANPGSYLGETFTFEENYSDDVDVLANVVRSILLKNTTIKDE